jgi:hypothetical protein
MQSYGDAAAGLAGERDWTKAGGYATWLRPRPTTDPTFRLVPHILPRFMDVERALLFAIAKLPYAATLAPSQAIHLSA